MIAKFIALVLYIVGAMQTHTRNIVWEITATEHDRACTECYNSCESNYEACEKCKGENYYD